MNTRQPKVNHGPGEKPLTLGSKKFLTSSWTTIPIKRCRVAIKTLAEEASLCINPSARENQLTSLRSVQPNGFSHRHTSQEGFSMSNVEQVLCESPSTAWLMRHLTGLLSTHGSSRRATWDQGNLLLITFLSLIHWSSLKQHLRHKHMSTLGLKGVSRSCNLEMICSQHRYELLSHFSKERYIVNINFL